MDYKRRASKAAVVCGSVKRCMRVAAAIPLVINKRNAPLQRPNIHTLKSFILTFNSIRHFYNHQQMEKTNIYRNTVNPKRIDGHVEMKIRIL